MEAKYKALSQFHDNEDKQFDDKEEGDTHPSGFKGGGFDFGNYALDDLSAIDPSSMYSDYAASQMLQASIEAHLESHLGKIFLLLREKTDPSGESGGVFFKISTLFDLLHAKYHNSSSAAQGQASWHNDG